MGDGEVVVSAGHAGGTRGSHIVSTTAVMLGMRRVGCGVCEMCMCLAWGVVGGEGG